MFGSCYEKRPALVTGHTGFKGSWLRLWLERLGAQVTGHALAPDTEPSHSELLALGSPSTLGDLRDLDGLMAHFAEHPPEIVFHLAAQSSVLVGYQEPIETFSTNVIGTAHVLEACRRTPSCRAVVIVTSDKAYENKEWEWGYREVDRLGGHDPYSASKACAELVAASYRRSFCGPAVAGRAQPLLVASARAGNVIGGGDWTADRLLPDMMRAAAQGEPVAIRNPDSSRPWQHVLEPLAGYLMLGQALLEGRADCAEAWNFGPAQDSNLTVGSMAEEVSALWPAVRPEIAPREGNPHEARLLMLDSSRAQLRLGWQPAWGIGPTLQRTVDWYRAYYERSEVISSQQIDEYTAEAGAQGAAWAE